MRRLSGAAPRPFRDTRPHTDGASFQKLSKTVVPTKDQRRLDYQRPTASWSLCFPSTHPVVCQLALLVKMTRIITDLQRATRDQSVGAALCRDWAAQRPRDFGFNAEIVGGRHAALSRHRVPPVGAGLPANTVVAATVNGGWRLASRAGPFAGKPAPTGDRWRLDHQRPAASWSLRFPSTHLGPSWVFSFFQNGARVFR